MAPKIKPCSPENKNWVEFSRLDLAIMGSEVTDDTFMFYLGGTEGVCKETKGGSVRYHLSPDAVERLRRSLRIQNTGISLRPDWQHLDFGKELALYLANPPPVFLPSGPREFYPDPNENINTGILLGNGEVAIVRSVLRDQITPPESSIFRRVPSPVGTMPDDMAFYSISVLGLVKLGVTHSAFDQIVIQLKQLYPDDPLALPRIEVLKNEIAEWKKLYQERLEPPKAGTIPIKPEVPDEFFGGEWYARAPKEMMRNYEREGLPQRTMPRNAVQCTKAVYLSDVAFMRLVTGDTDNEFFTTHPGTPWGDTEDARTVFIDRDVPWQELIDAYDNLAAIYGKNLRYAAMHAHAAKMSDEMKRLKTRVDDESYWHKLKWDSPLVIGFGALSLAGAGLGVGLRLARRNRNGGGRPGGRGGAAQGPGQGDSLPSQGEGDSSTSQRRIEECLYFGVGVLFLIATLGAAGFSGGSFAPQPAIYPGDARPKREIY